MSEDVRADYEHIVKRVTPSSPVVFEGATLKWYDIAPADAPIPSEIHDLARSCLTDGLTTGDFELPDELGFVILHRCGESFYFLLISTWRNENELWETVWAKSGPDDRVFRPWPLARTHHPTFCVWELGAVCHEQRAWTAYLRSTRGETEREEYLASCFAGDV
jgi:hypothetical protein